MTGPECFRCGAGNDLERFGGGFLCGDCVPDGDSTADSQDQLHENPIDAADVDDAERAAMLRDYLEAFVDEFGQVPRLMPLDEEGKAPIIQGRARLDSPEGRSFLVDGEAAIRQIREEGSRGFAIYAGKPDHNTEEALFVDHDDDAFPTPTGEPTLEVLSGSGRGAHETYRNAGDVANARVGDNLGEIRAENWYVVTPGSIHPTGGVYHVREERPIATLADDELDDSMRPASSRTDREPTAPTAADLDGEGDRPDDVLQERLERAFANSHDGNRVEQVYDGNYRAAGFDDRSAAEFWLANRLDSWVGLGDRHVVADLMDKADLQKWPERTDRSYRDSVLSEVGYQDWYYDPEGDDAEPVAAIPTARLAALDSGEMREVARRRGDWPDTRQVRRRLADRIQGAMRAGERTVIDAPTSAGKTHTVATTGWRAKASATGERPVVHTHGTQEARDQAAAASAHADGVGHAKLLGRSEACPLAAGDHDPQNDPELAVTVHGQPVSEWFATQCDEKGISFSFAHAYALEHHDQDHDELPCAAGCQAVEQHHGLPTTDDGDPAVDVIHATHQFLHVPSYRLRTNVVLDEHASFIVDIGTGRVQRAVGAFLKTVDAPVRSWEAFVALARHDAARGDAARERDATHDALQGEPDREWYIEHPDAHTLAPAIARAVWYALRDDADANGRRASTVPHEPPRLDADARDSDGWNREWVTVVLDEDNRVRRIRQVPDFSQARSVIGLEARPTPWLWQQTVAPDMTVDRILEPEERRRWRLFERGLQVVQVGDATRPLASGEYFNEPATREVVRALRAEYGDDFRTAITAASVEDRLDTILQDVGVDDPETMHYGAEKSRNDFAGERVGFVNGSIDPGDEYVLDWLAECDLEAEPETTDAGDRAHGRGFTGPDADAAAAFLASVREHHVAQGAGRYARNADDPDDRATVFVRTDATPPGFVDAQVPGVEWVPTDKQRRVLEALAEREQATTRELADAADVSKETARRTLDRKREAGTVARREGAGEHGAHLYRVLADGDGLGSGEVELSPEETATDRVVDSYTWAVAVSPPNRSAPPDVVGEQSRSAPDAGRQVALGTADGSDRPPDPT